MLFVMNMKYWSVGKQLLFHQMFHKIYQKLLRLYNFTKHYASNIFHKNL